MFLNYVINVITNLLIFNLITKNNKKSICNQYRFSHSSKSRFAKKC